MSFGSIQPLVHVIAPEVVYYELLWILRLILSRNMRREQKEVSASCKITSQFISQ